MILVLEVPFAAIALILSVISLKSLRTIKHLGIGRSFWIPLLLSGIFFSTGSVLTILSDFGFSFISYIGEIVEVSQLIAMCALLSGVFTYSRTVTRNLAKFDSSPSTTALAPARIVSDYKEEELSGSNLEEVVKKTPRPETSAKDDVECRYGFGYLRTLPKDSAIPDDCLNCRQIIECKHSYFRKVGRKPVTPSSETVSDVMVSDTELEEETVEDG